MDAYLSQCLLYIYHHFNIKKNPFVDSGIEELSIFNIGKEEEHGWFESNNGV